NYKTKAVVLSRKDLGEADRILTLYTKDFGKIKAKAVGVRRAKSKLAGSLELFNSGLIFLAQGKTFDVICGCEIDCHHQKIKKSLRRTSLAYYIGELVLKLTPEHLKSPPVFDLLIEALSGLDKEEESNLELIVSFFELRLLSFLGYTPEFSRCIHCRKVLIPKENYFSFTSGGILCHDCKETEENLILVSSQAVKIIRFIYKDEFANLKRIKDIVKYLPEVRNLSSNFIQFIIEKDLKSQDFIKSIENLEKK
nr:DNA repair protein RecO [Candidatus Aenigmarchaeota archaeon]